MKIWKNVTNKRILIPVLIALFVLSAIFALAISAGTETTPMAYALSYKGDCKHYQVIYEHIDGTQKHVKRCKECGKNLLD